MIQPDKLPEDLREAARLTRSENPDDAVNLFNIHWKDDLGEVMGLVMPSELTGVSTPIVVLLGQKFPTGSYQVGSAYSILAEKQLYGEIVPQKHRLVVPSVGNFGIATAWLGRRMGYPVTAILPDSMPAEKMEVLRNYGADVVKVPGGPSDMHRLLEATGPFLNDSDCAVVNPYIEFGGYRFHAEVTANAVTELAEGLARQSVGRGRVSAFVAAVGSGGVLGAADTLKEKFQTLAVAVEPLECSTLFDAGFGSHRVWEAGPQMVPWIHNVWSLDAVVGIHDMDAIRGMALLHDAQTVLTEDLGISEDTANRVLGMFGPCGVMSLLGAIKTIHHFGLGPDDLVVTVAPDSADRYQRLVRWLASVEGEQTRELALRRVEIFLRTGPGWVLDGTPRRRRRWHNQKYPTWVEQWGKSLDALQMQRDPEFWRKLRARTDIIDRQIRARRPMDA